MNLSDRKIMVALNWYKNIKLHSDIVSYDIYRPTGYISILLLLIFKIQSSIQLYTRKGIFILIYIFWNVMRELL